MLKPIKNNPIEHLKLKKFLRIMRFFSVLVGIFIIVLNLFIASIDELWSKALISICIGFIFWVIMDNTCDKYEERLIDYEELYINKKN